MQEVFKMLSCMYQKKIVISIHLFYCWIVLRYIIEGGKTHSKQYPFLSENGVVTVRVGE